MNRDDSRIAIQDMMLAAFPAAEERVARFYAMQQYQLGWRDERLVAAHAQAGKLLRPYIVLCAACAAGGDPRRALPLESICEFRFDSSFISLVR